MSSWESSACYPRRTFYPLSDGPSTRDHRITMTDFRLCLSRRSCSQAGLCHCTQQPISDRSEPTIARLRYSLGGDRPSQTAHHTRSRTQCWVAVRHQDHKGWYFTLWLHPSWRLGFKASHLFYTIVFHCHSEAAVKVHGVFPSNRGYSASSRRIQFR